MPNEFKERTEDILKENDSIQNYLDNRIVKTSNEKDAITKSDIFDDYIEYCKKNSQKFSRRSSLFNRLSQEGFTVKKLDGYDRYKCIKYKTEEDTQEKTEVIVDYKYLYELSKEQINKLESKIQGLENNNDKNIKLEITKIEKKN
eukprot:gene14304-19186_t